MNKTQCHFECKNKNGFILPQIIENLNQTKGPRASLGKKFTSNCQFVSSLRTK